MSVVIPPALPYTGCDAPKVEAQLVSRHIAAVLRRFPMLMRLPYFAYQRTRARYTLGVAAVILDQRGAVLLVEHAYHPRFPWGLPGGWIDADEDPAAAVLREVREELSLDARIGTVVYAARTAPNHIDIAFQCNADGDVGKLSHELLDYRWLDCESLPPLKPFHARAIELARRAQSVTWSPV